MYLQLFFDHLMFTQINCVLNQFFMIQFVFTFEVRVKDNDLPFDLTARR